MSNEAILMEIREMISELRGKLDHMESMLEGFVENEPEKVEEEPIETFSEPIEIELDVQDSFEEYSEPEPEPIAEPEPIPEPIPEPEPIAEPEPEPESVNEKAAEEASLSIQDAISSASYAWKVDIPGAEVRNILSGISLNDRILFINSLFGEDPFRFQSAISAFNAMSSLSEVENYIAANYPDWNLNSEIVYRMMMAVRRKIR